MRALSPPQTVSAVILAFNRADDVDHTLDRLAGEPLDEVIVVDSGDDDTSERVRARGGNVRLVKTGDIGAAARNYGAAEARSWVHTTASSWGGASLQAPLPNELAILEEDR